LSERINELRWNPLLGSWIIVSARRKKRPWRDVKCPFCPGAEETGYGWEVLVLDNRFPALDVNSKTYNVSKDIYKVDKAYGYCKVVIETPEHEGDLDTVSYNNLVRYIKVLKDETKKLCSDPKIEYVFPFRNKGKEIGVSLMHPHSQIYALPFVPPRIIVESRNMKKFYDENNECLLCRIIKLEKEEGERLLYENRYFVSFLPFYAMWPYEVHIYPKEHCSSLVDLSQEQIKYLADILKVVVSGYNNLFSFSLPYIMAFHQKPCKGNYNFFHFHIEFYPVHRDENKLKFPAGIERGAWTFTYDGLPEERALELRKAIRRALEKMEKIGYVPLGKSY